MCGVNRDILSVCSVATVYTVCLHETMHMSLCVQVSLSLSECACVCTHAIQNNFVCVCVCVEVCAATFAGLCMHLVCTCANISSVSFARYTRMCSRLLLLLLLRDRVCLFMCVCACCRRVEDCLPPEGLSLPAACGNHGALPGYKPLVCTDKKT